MLAWNSSCRFELLHVALGLLISCILMYLDLDNLTYNLSNIFKKLLIKMLTTFSFLFPANFSLIDTKEGV